MNAIRTERDTVNSAVAAYEHNGGDTQNLPADEKRRQIQQMINDRVRERVSGILNQDQLAAFVQYQAGSQ